MNPADEALLAEDLEDIDVATAIACVRRELAMRDQVYPRQVRAGNLKPEKADHERRAMRAVLQLLLKLQSIATVAKPAMEAWPVVWKLPEDLPDGLARDVDDGALKLAWGEWMDAGADDPQARNSAAAGLMSAWLRFLHGTKPPGRTAEDVLACFARPICETWAALDRVERTGTWELADPATEGRTIQ